MEVKYDCETNPREHIQLCTTTWKEIPQQEWVHRVIHTLETIPQNWYLERDLRHGIASWEDMVDGFILTFIVEDDCPYIDSSLQIVKRKISENTTPRTWKQLDWVAEIEHALEFYNLIAEEE